MVIQTSESSELSYDFAHLILGDDFISPKELARVCGVAYTFRELTQLLATLPGREELEWCRGHHCMLVPGPPRAMCLFDIRALHSNLFFKNGHLGHEDWYDRQWRPYVSAERFAGADTVEALSWIALSSLDKLQNERMYAQTHTFVPNIAAVAWGLAAYRAYRNLLFFPGVRTSSFDSEGNCVCIAYQNTFRIFHLHNEAAKLFFVAAVARKFPAV